MQRELMAAVWAVELHVLLTQTKEQLTKKLMVVGMRHFSRPGNLVSLRNQTPSFWDIQVLGSMDLKYTYIVDPKVLSPINHIVRF